MATVRCSRCFMMNVPEALHCIGCGADLGLMPVLQEEGSTWHCPRCRTSQLDAFSTEDGLLFDCRSCGGQFVSHAVLQSLVQRHRAASVQPVRLRPNNPLGERITYLACPNCKEFMHRRNFGSISGVIVDVCSLHGTWFDVGELARILAFVGNGGLAQAERIKTEQSRRQSLASPTAAPNLLLSSGTTDDFAVWGDMYHAAADFARWALRLLR